jgi:hypothetical protein
MCRLHGKRTHNHSFRSATERHNLVSKSALDSILSVTEKILGVLHTMPSKPPTSGAERNMQHLCSLGRICGGMVLVCTSSTCNMLSSRSSELSRRLKTSSWVLSGPIYIFGGLKDRRLRGRTTGICESAVVMLVTRLCRSLSSVTDRIAAPATPKST